LCFIDVTSRDKVLLLLYWGLGKVLEMDVNPGCSFLNTALGGSSFNSGRRMFDLILLILMGLLVALILGCCTFVDFATISLVLLLVIEFCSFNCLGESYAFSVCWLENGPVAIGMVVL
jgi:hypothetical protein